MFMDRKFISDRGCVEEIDSYVRIRFGYYNYMFQFYTSGVSKKVTLQKNKKQINILIFVGFMFIPMPSYIYIRVDITGFFIFDFVNQNIFFFENFSLLQILSMYHIIYNGHLWNKIISIIFIP